jgi:KaiC/GvpD/RAD55 family RecA-like ATPase
MTEKSDISVDAEALKKSLATILFNAQIEQDVQAFEKSQKLNTFVTKSTIENAQYKALVGIKTGTLFDNLFLDNAEKPIDGIPFGTSMIITGLPNSGKSIEMEELVLNLAFLGHKVCYGITEEIFTTDTPRYDLQTRMKEKALILKLDWTKIADNLFILDAVAHPELRNWNTFIGSYRALVEDSKVDIALIDSMTLLEDSRGQVKFRVLELVRYNQLHGVTSIMINQRGIDEADGLSMAGGISLGYSVDILVAMDYKKAWSGDSQLKLDTGVKQGDIINFVRVLKCRVCRYDAHYIQYTITQDGLVRQAIKPNI